MQDTMIVTYHYAMQRTSTTTHSNNIDLIVAFSFFGGSLTY